MAAKSRIIPLGLTFCEDGYGGRSNQHAMMIFNGVLFWYTERPLLMSKRRNNHSSYNCKRRFDPANSFALFIYAIERSGNILRFANRSCIVPYISQRQLPL